MPKKNKNNAGRKTVMSYTVLRKLAHAYLMDCTDEEACFYAGIGVTTLYEYQKKNPKFRELKQQWKQRPVFVARQTVINELKKNPELSFKYLERKKKSEFAQKTELDHSGEITFNVVYEDEPKQADDE